MNEVIFLATSYNFLNKNLFGKRVHGNMAPSKQGENLLYSGELKILYIYIWEVEVSFTTYRLICSIFFLASIGKNWNQVIELIDSFKIFFLVQGKFLREIKYPIFTLRYRCFILSKNRIVGDLVSWYFTFIIYSDCQLLSSIQKQKSIYCTVATSKCFQQLLWPACKLEDKILYIQIGIIKVSNDNMIVTTVGLIFVT